MQTLSYRNRFAKINLFLYKNFFLITTGKRSLIFDNFSVGFDKLTESIFLPIKDFLKKFHFDFLKRNSFKLRRTSHLCCIQTLYFNFRIFFYS